MCEFSQKLIAWLDRELPVDEALEVEPHLDSCAKCRDELRGYERLTSALDAYCDAAMESAAPRNEPSWKLAALGAGSVAAVLALLLGSPLLRKPQPTISVTLAMASVPVHAIDSTGAPVPSRSVIPSPLGRARDFSSISRKGKRESMPRITASVLPEPKDNALNALNVPATPAAVGWRLAEPAIQISIPAEAVLPPGAAPAGVSFVAEVSIAPDGSAHQIFLQP
jgi:hypothetical protein